MTTSGEGQTAGSPDGDIRTRPLERDRVVETLVEHYANDTLDMREFERRVELAHRSRTRDELRRLLADLPPLAGVAPVPFEAPDASGVKGSTGTGLPAVRGEASHLVRLNPNPPPERQTEVAIWSGRVRKGSWAPARRIRAMALMGGVELDLREALLPPGETHIFAGALMGGVEILVPPGVRVETDGFAFMGGFEEETENSVLGPDAPTVRVSGFAMMGAVEVTMRRPGESARDAKRRRREAARRAREAEG